MEYGQRCPFDTAVAIQINQYRLESEKLNICDSVNMAVTEYINEIELEKNTNTEIINNLMYINGLYKNELQRKDIVIQDISLKYKELSGKREKTWFEKNKGWVYGAVGVVIGSYSTYLICK